MNYATEKNNKVYVMGRSFPIKRSRTKCTEKDFTNSF